MRNVHSQKALSDLLTPSHYLGDPSSPSTICLWTQKLGFRTHWRVAWTLSQVASLSGDIVLETLACAVAEFSIL